jgi:hypothetical protein
MWVPQRNELAEAGAMMMGVRINAAKIDFNLLVIGDSFNNWVSNLQNIRV